jgi:hypothetical protein
MSVSTGLKLDVFLLNKMKMMESNISDLLCAFNICSVTPSPCSQLHASVKRTTFMILSLHPSGCYM